MRYAKGTGVPVVRTRQEIEGLLERHGASRTFAISDDGQATIGFVLEDRMVRFDLKLPKKDERRFWQTPTGLKREGVGAEDAARRAWEQECRELWRALALSIKAKLVSVENGVESFEQAFLAHVVTDDGRTTVYQWLRAKMGAEALSAKTLGSGL